MDCSTVTATDITWAAAIIMMSVAVIIITRMCPITAVTPGTITVRMATIITTTTAMPNAAMARITSLPNWFTALCVS